METSWETCSGLVWIGGRAAPWLCEANAHVYNVRVAPWPDPPSDRPTLRWEAFALAGPVWRIAYVQVKDGVGELRVGRLEVDGTPLEIGGLHGPA